MHWHSPSITVKQNCNNVSISFTALPSKINFNLQLEQFYLLDANLVQLNLEQQQKISLWMGQKGVRAQVVQIYLLLFSLSPKVYQCLRMNGSKCHCFFQTVVNVVTERAKWIVLQVHLQVKANQWKHSAATVKVEDMVAIIHHFPFTHSFKNHSTTTSDHWTHQVVHGVRPQSRAQIMHYGCFCTVDATVTHCKVSLTAHCTLTYTYSTHRHTCAIDAFCTAGLYLLSNNKHYLIEMLLVTVTVLHFILF